jgi:hypothetical protein
VFCLVHFRRKYKEVDPLATTQDSLRRRIGNSYREGER